LIRRRCRYVIVVDAAEDPLDSSENLANLIRLVRTDFGIAIDIDTAPLRKDEKGLSRWHCAIGAIRYDEVDPSGVTGTLLFIRSSLTGDEDADLRNYAVTHPPFPHHPTSDQFFDEAQFESYRDLGYHVGMSVFSEACEAVGRSAQGPDARPPATQTDRTYRGTTRELFAALRREWSPLPAGGGAAYTASCRDYLAVVGELRKDRDLRRVSGSLFPEVALLPRGAEGQATDGDVYTDLHEIDALLQVMELSWLENDLDRFHAHPLNRGWMNVMRRWTASDLFHRYWVVLRAQYSRGFVRFCERALNLDPLPVQWVALDELGDHAGQVLEQFDKEFHSEWGGVLRDTVGLAERQRCYVSWVVGRSRVKGKRLAWILSSGPPWEAPGAVPPESRRDQPRLPLGVVVAFPPEDGPKERWELLVWVRSASRSLGLGRGSVGRILDLEILLALAGSVAELLVRYPRIGTTLGERLQCSVWTWFFNDLDFVRPCEEQDPAAVRLVRRLSTPATVGATDEPRAEAAAGGAQE
jgi:hypothetical protein